MLMQPEADSDELRSFGFSFLFTSANFASSLRERPDRMCGVEGIIVVNVGADPAPVVDFFALSDPEIDLPPSIAVLMLPAEELSKDFVTELVQGRAVMEAGADDVIPLLQGEVLQPHRVMISFEQTSRDAALAARLVGAQVAMAVKKQDQALEDWGKKYLWQLPGLTLPRTPPFSHLDEQVDNKDCHGIGDYALVGALGAGAFGVVIKARHPQHGTCALKFISKQRLKTVGMLMAVNAEVSMLMGLARHPNVIYAHEVLDFKGNTCIAMSFVGDLNLGDYVATVLQESGAEVLPQPILVDVCTQAAAGVGHLHAQLVCHRDIKPSNFIVSNCRRRICLADFGFACRVCSDLHKLRNRCGSLPFVDPEVLAQGFQMGSGRGYRGLAADVWSLAVNFLELANGRFAAERLLGWVPHQPSDPLQQWRDLQGMEAAYRRSPPIRAERVARAVDRMLLRRPAERCSAQWVCGSDGLGSPSELLDQKPLRGQRRHGQQQQ